MYGTLYGTVWPYLQHECMVWYGSMAPLLQAKINWLQQKRSFQFFLSTHMSEHFSQKNSPIFAQTGVHCNDGPMWPHYLFKNDCKSRTRGRAGAQKFAKKHHHHLPQLLHVLDHTRGERVLVVWDDLEMKENNEHSVQSAKRVKNHPSGHEMAHTHTRQQARPDSRQDGSTKRWNQTPSNSCFHFFSGTQSLTVYITHGGPKLDGARNQKTLLLNYCLDGEKCKPNLRAPWFLGLKEDNFNVDQNNLF